MHQSRLQELVRGWLHRPLLRRAERAGRIALSPLQYLRRRHLARELLAGRPAALHLDPGLGYARFGPGALGGSEELLSLAQAELARLRPRLERPAEGRRGARQLVEELGSDALLAREPRFVEFALSDEVVRPVLEYLGEVPFLARISLALSRPLAAAAEPVHFQRFHVDNDDLRHVKLYLNAQEVAARHGPLCFLPARTSERVLRALAREGKHLGPASSFSDEEVFRHCERDELVELEGSRASGAFVDLSRCLHYGSRVAAAEERLQLVLVFLRRHRLHENASSQIAPPAGQDELRALLLDPPRRHPPGFFFPESVA